MLMHRAGRNSGARPLVDRKSNAIWRSNTIEDERRRRTALNANSLPGPMQINNIATK